ncbi:MAG TPA: hypothetical protein VGO80_18200 [Solirubrobacteraceae bacterium]|jgi:spore coat polysaccharide biosynthesis predicted glycosyltransferase SpsG|nr:hypothetical protein [Solirubrobacteraceae bacterium]
MQPARPATAAPRLALRCDGDDEIGAGHVARCLPLAEAFRQRGWDCVFVGRFGGLARWLLERERLASAPAQDGPAGLRAGEWTAAVVDGYAFDEAQLCALARALPVAFVGEAARCPDAGVHIDYHFTPTPTATATATPAATPTPTPTATPAATATPTARAVGVLRGPRYAPVDPRFAAAADDRREVRAALVTVGGSRAARTLAGPAVDALREAFPLARVWVASGVEIADRERVTALAFPGSLLDVVADVDVAVSAAGLTAYELAAAGVASVLVAVAANQQPVIDGFERAGAALTVAAGEPQEALTAAVGRLREPALRASLSAAGRALVDARGAARVAAALDERWRGAASAHRGWGDH